MGLIVPVLCSFVAALACSLVFGSCCCVSWCMSFHCSLQLEPIAAKWPGYRGCTLFAPLSALQQAFSSCLHLQNLHN